jgi:hypothetical protein
MADYDSSTPLYDFLPHNFLMANRGSVPLAWGIDPSLLETYPDLIAYFYSLATPADTFTADASAAGYTNPSRIPEKSLPLFVEHNRQFFREADMDIAPMVLDWTQPTPAVMDAFCQFSAGGFATIIYDFHGGTGRPARPQVWRGMAVTELINDAGDAFSDADKTADTMARAIRGRGGNAPGFYFFRIVWANTGNVLDSIALLRKKLPELDIEVLDPHAFFGLLRQYQEQHEPSPARRNKCRLGPLRAPAAPRDAGRAHASRPAARAKGLRGSRNNPGSPQFP